MRHLLAFLLLALCLSSPVVAQDLQPILQDHAEEIAKPSRGSVGTALDAMIDSGLPQVPVFLERWTDKGVWQRDADGMFFYGAARGNDLTLTDIDTGAESTVPKAGHTELRPNGGVRRVIGTALVQFQLTDPDIARRLSAIDSLARRPDADQLAPLLASTDDEPDAALKARKIQLANFLSASFAPDPADRIAAIDSLASDTTIEARAVLNQILATTPYVGTATPDGNVARILTVGDGLTAEEAYARLVAEGLAPPAIPAAQVRDALAANIFDGRVGDVALAQLSDPAARDRAYATLAAAGTVPPRLTDQGRAEAIASHTFADLYSEPDPAITDAARAALTSVETRVAAERVADLALDALSLASIYFLAAIGLAITFGVMGVINMAHGEFIMMGAYTGYVIQQFIPDYTLSLIVALPTAFAVTFAAGVIMERLVIRHLAHRPLETLLATFGISIALQQLAKNIFGTQARPLTSPGWLDGAWVLTDVVQISYIRIAIFVLALMFLGLILFILKRTRLGLEVRAVTQNPGMAASMGIDPDRINMLTFGLGSGIAGIAGVAIGLYAKVTSEMGADYIVQSFMTVVVGGVGNVWGTLAGATLIGVLQKGIEWFNPSNTLAAQTYMVLFIILFIQFRPRGIVAQKGRAAAD